MIHHAHRFAAVALSCALYSCVPWTVRPIDAGEDVSKTAATLSPAAYVNSLWSSQFLNTIEKSAVDARTFLDAYAKSPADALARWGRRDANGPVYLTVKGEGRVVSIDTQSKVGLALLDVAPFDGKPDVTVQIGPVLRGTSLRDATGLLRFTDFVNQLQFADVANELNDRVSKTILSPIPLASLSDKSVAFAGTAVGEVNAAPPVRELIPVRLTIQEGR
jgi:predicted lipoprotein